MRAFYHANRGSRSRDPKLALDPNARRGYRSSMPEPKKRPVTPTEHDEGYNESHGYGPGHGGPTGPGDAPSPQPATIVPTPDDDETDP